MVNLRIDGKNVQIRKGATILEAAETIGVRIPTLCFLKKISPTGACRVCVVEIEGASKPMTACNTPAVEGMVVTTQSEKLSAIRRQVVELLLVNHPLDCPVCDAGGECDLQDICYSQDVIRQPFGADDVSHPVINDWPLIQQVPSRCILCEKCVKVCHEVVGASALVVREAGEKAFIDTVDGMPLQCEFCGNCVDECPTGTLISKPFKFKARPWELRKVPSVCTYCGSQCQVDINVKQDKVYRITSEDGVTRNDGTLCIGGYFGHGYIHSPSRLTRPLVKKGEALSPASWDEALGAVAGIIGEIKTTAGADVAAGLSSPRLTNEENYLFQKLFRAAIGSNNIDSEARFGALRTLRTLDAAMGLKGASNRIDRIGEAEAILVFGSDITAEAPAIDWQIEQACRKRDGKLVVANMRRVKLVRFAESFLNYRPGTEIQLANALSRILLEKGLADENYLQRYVKNLDQLRAALLAVDLEKAARETGLTLEALEAAAQHIGRADSVAVILGGDIIRSEQSEQKTAAIAHLALVAGALHGDIGGLFPVDEKGNMQGLLDMGVYPEALPGYQDYRQARTVFEKAWGVSLPNGGRDALSILEGIEKGEIRFLYLAAVNPLVSFPDAGRWRKALQKVEFLVVQDILASGLTELAHVVLPGVSFAEKSGTVTALDHRIGCLTPAISPVGEARRDLDIFADLYQRLAGAGKQDLAAVSAELGELTALYSDVCTVHGQGCRTCLKEPFRPADHSIVFTPVEEAEPSGGNQLLSGKILFHFGTTSTFAEANLEAAPEGYIEIHPEDAQGLGIGDGDRMKVSSATGSATGRARLSDNLPRGLLFAPYHFSDLNIQQVIPATGNRTAVQVAKA
jgi:formate dehydrogenase alpha subunit